jgi:hypothetical protein
MECFLRVSKYGSGAVIETVFKIALCPSRQGGIFFLPNHNIYVYFSEIPHYIAQNFILNFFARLKESPSVYNSVLRSLSCFKWNTPLRIQELLLFGEDLSKRDF